MPEIEPLEDLDADLRACVDDYVAELDPGPAGVEAALARAHDGISASGGGLLGSGAAKIGLAAAVATVLAVAAWPREDPPPPVPTPVLAPERPPTPAPAPEPSTTPVVEPTTDPPAPEPTVEPEVRLRRKAVRQKEPAPKPSLAAELELLRSARAALRRGDSREALALARQHARQYPASAFAEERSATEVMALCRLGKTTEAGKKAARFRKKHPGSTFEAGLMDACEDLSGAPPSP